MAQFSISSKKLGQLRRKAAEAAGDRDTVAVALGEVPPMLELQWLAGDRKTALGQPFVVEAKDTSAPLEAFRPTGNIESIMVPTGLEFDADAPEGTRYLRVNQGEASDTLAVAGLAGPGPLDPEGDKRFYAEAAEFVFPVFAERFTDADRFFAFVDSLYHWIMQLAPFNAPGMDQRFALHGYYWTTDLSVGQFNTRDISYNCALAHLNPAVTFNGNNANARAALGHLMLEGRYGLVLIDSGVRGGAGGMAKQRYPAWASVAACPGEAWQAVALHEIGHALGLSDEYLDSQRQGEKRDEEPNCATSHQAGDVPWAFPGGAHVFTLADQAQIGHAGGLPVPAPGTVGLFQGARYRSDYFRPSLNCLMRQTDCLRFCQVCQEAIRAKL